MEKDEVMGGVHMRSIYITHTTSLLVQDFLFENFLKLKRRLDFRFETLFSSLRFLVP